MPKCQNLKKKICYGLIQLMCQNLVVSKTKVSDESEKSVEVPRSDIRRNTEMLQEQELTSQVFLNCMI